MRNEFGLYLSFRMFYKLFFQFVYLHPVHCHFDGIVVGVRRFHPCGANLHVNEQEIGCAKYVYYLSFAPFIVQLYGYFALCLVRFCEIIAFFLSAYSEILYIFVLKSHHQSFMERLQATFDKLLRETTSTFHRYMYDRIDWQARVVGLLGPRGVGKTTMVLQYIKENLPRKETLYVVAEDLYFSTHTLVDLADAFARIGGKYLFIDEIHKYKGWSRELKLIYDYHSELHVFFTGSSVLDISKGVADLSRRVLTFEMQGLSYREYLELFHQIELPIYNIHQILAQEVVLPRGFLPLQHFTDYLKRGFYPFRDDNIERYIMQMVNTTLEVDIAQYADLTPATIRKLKRLLAFIAQAAPFKPNFTQLGGQLEVSRNNIADLCAWLEKAGLIGQLRDSTGGIQGLGRVDKVYLDNPTLIYVLGKENTEIGTIRETFFFNQMRVAHDIASSLVSDFLVTDRYTFEVGGKKKKQKQIQNVEQGYVVKDDIETGYGNIVPLWQFGLTY